MADAAQRRLQISPRPRLARRGPAPDAHPDGTGRRGHGGHAGERVREYRARHQHGRRRGVVAELRVSPDVSADRSVRCVDCDRRVTDGIAPEHAAGLRRRARDRHQQPVADAHAQHPSHGRTRGAGRTHRSRAARTRPLHASRHARHGGGAAVLRHRPDRLLGCPYRLAHLLCARAQSHTGHRQRGRGAGECTRSTICSCTPASVTADSRWEPRLPR